LQRIAVNVPTSESDLTAMAENEFTRKIGRTAPDNSGAGVTIDGIRHRPLWPMLLAACMALLLFEIVLANRTNI
jgi:hypothetical protein